MAQSNRAMNSSSFYEGDCKPGLQAWLSWDYELVFEVKANHVVFVSLFKTDSPSGVCSCIHVCVEDFLCLFDFP